MKKIIFLVLIVFLLSVLPVTAQSDDLQGTWLGLISKEDASGTPGDFKIVQFSQDGSSYEVLNVNNDSYNKFSGTWRSDSQNIILTNVYEEQHEVPYRFENGELYMVWDDENEQSFIRIDDSYFPEYPESLPFVGEDQQYTIMRAADGAIGIDVFLGDEETIEIPAEIFGIPVTEIGDAAIIYKQEMKHLILPDSIRTIGYHAFEENSLLEDVRMPNSLETLDQGVFLGDWNLKEINIPEGIKILPEDTFWNCAFLEQVILPESLEEVRPDAFNWTERTSFVVKQGSYAEQFCKENGYPYTALDGEKWKELRAESTDITEIIPEGSDDDLAGTWIAFDEGDFTFFRISPDGNITILSSHGYYPETYSGTWKTEGRTIIFTQDDGFGNSYEEEQHYSFSQGKLFLFWSGTEYICTRIDDSEFPEDIEASPYLGENKIYWIDLLEDDTIQISAYVGTAQIVNVPDTVFGLPVTAIRETAFMSHDGLKRVIIPHGITFIGRQAFAYDDALESVELPDTLSTLEYSAFEFCRNLKEIIIPEGVTFLDYSTFGDCDSLTSVTLPESLEAIDDAFDSRTKGSILFTVQPGSFAEQYCQENGLNYIHPGEEPVVQNDDEPVKDEPQESGDEMPDEDTKDGDDELYQEAMALFEEEMYYSARQAFLESGYGDWEEMAEKCIQPMPSTGEIWRDRSQWLQDMELTIIVEHPLDVSMFVRIFKDNAPVSCLFINGSEPVTVRLPGNGYYEIKDGSGHIWYGIKEAFGRDGSYEVMTFDDEGTQKVFLQSYHAYTLSINTSTTTGGEDVLPEAQDWDKFIQ